MSNDSDLRAAAERYTDGRYADFTEMHEQPLQRSRDASALARAYITLLTSQPADGEEAIQSDWLEQVGAIKDGCQFKWTLKRDGLGIGLWLVDDGWKVMLILTPHSAACITRGLVTRFDVRRLCGVLGIQLKETTT